MGLVMGHTVFQGGGALWTLPTALAKKAKFANRRARYRKSTGPDITPAEVTDLWVRCRGHCEHCGLRLHFRWDARDPPNDFAVLDRIDGSKNRSYAGNARFLCFGCNSERGGWELARNLQRALTECRTGITGGGIGLDATIGAYEDHLVERLHVCPKNPNVSDMRGLMGLMRAALMSIRARERVDDHRLVHDRRVWNTALHRLRGGAQTSNVNLLPLEQ